MRLEGWEPVLLFPPFETRPYGAAPQGEVISSSPERLSLDVESQQVVLGQADLVMGGLRPMLA